jgi:pilus assembly protein Flp/PilA
MRNFVKLAKQFKSDENGAAFVEYTVLLGIMLVGVIAVIGTVGTDLKTYWNNLVAAIAPAA